MAEKDSVSLRSHPQLFLTPRTEAQADTQVQKGSSGPPSLLGRGSHHPPTIAKLLHCWPSESQGKSCRGTGEGSSPPTGIPPQLHPPLCDCRPSASPSPTTPCICSFMRAVHTSLPGPVLVRRTQPWARELGGPCPLGPFSPGWKMDHKQDGVYNSVVITAVSAWKRTSLW